MALTIFLSVVIPFYCKIIPVVQAGASPLCARD